MADPSEPPHTDVPDGEHQAQGGGTPSKSFNSDAWIGGGVWLVVIAAVAYFWFFSGQVDLLMNVSGTDALVAEGVITSDAGPVSSGTIQVLIEDPHGDRLLASAVGDVTEKATFRVVVQRSQFAYDPADGLRIRGNYRGRTAATKEGKALKGTATVYVNTTPPWGMSWGFGALVVVLVGLVVLFTGPLPPRKARLLFGVTYIVTFSACVIPIVMTIAASGSPALLATMRRAPVGIVNAKAKGLEEAQWLVNIGGSVNEISSEESGAGGRLLPSGQATAVVSIQTPPASQSPAGPSPPAAPATAGQATSDAGAAPSTEAEPKETATRTAINVPVRVEPRGLEIKGGLAIPLYVIVLAMLGAGINMTRKVPQIQTDYDSPAAATLEQALSAPVRVFGMGKGTDTHAATHPKTSVIRQELIETYMYFLSAPFLAVAGVLLVANRRQQRCRASARCHCFRVGPDVRVGRRCDHGVR